MRQFANRVLNRNQSILIDEHCLVVKNHTKKLISLPQKVVACFNIIASSIFFKYDWELSKYLELCAGSSNDNNNNNNNNTSEHEQKRNQAVAYELISYNRIIDSFSHMYNLVIKKQLPIFK